MTAQSKPELSDAQKKAAANAIFRHFFLGVGMVCTVIQPEPGSCRYFMCLSRLIASTCFLDSVVFQTLYNGDIVKAIQTM